MMASKEERRRAVCATEQAANQVIDAHYWRARRAFLDDIKALDVQREIVLYTTRSERLMALTLIDKETE